MALLSSGSAPPCSFGYHLERGGVPLHDAVGINCEKGALVKIKALVSSTWAKGCWKLVSVIRLDMRPSSVDGESHGIFIIVMMN